MIGENAFPRLSQDVTIPSTVTTIKKNAFEAYKLYHLLITKHESVKTIEENDTVGIIICKQDNEYVIKYCSDDRIIAREYELV